MQEDSAYGRDRDAALDSEGQFPRLTRHGRVSVGRVNPGDASFHGLGPRDVDPGVHEPEVVALEIAEQHVTAGPVG